MAGYKQPSAQGQQVEDFFGLVDAFGSYVSKPEVTNITPNFLTLGSKNVLIDYANRIISRPGYALYNQANNGGPGIQGSYEWETSTGSQFSLRAYGTMLEFDWNSSYNVLLNNLTSPFVEFTKVLDFTEQQDVLLFVQGTSAMGRWSGGVSKIASSTATTVTKQGVLTAKMTISFVAGTPGSVAPTILDSANEFLIAGFAAGDTLNVTGSSGNSRQYTIGAVTAGVITLVMTDILVTEAVGTPITMYNQTGPTWKSARFFSTISPRAITYNGVSYPYTGGENTDTLTGLTGFPVIIPAINPIIDSYSESNSAGDVPIDNAGFNPTGIGQSFTASQNALLSKSTFFVSNPFPSNASTLVAKLYTIAGVYGSTSVPSTLLATSDTINVSTFNNSVDKLVDFPFSGNNQVALVAGTQYFITIEITTPGKGFYIAEGTGGASGNIATFKSGVWTPQGLGDLCFYVYGVGAGAPTWQTPDSIALPSAITSPFPNFFPNLIGNQLNMVFLASTSSAVIFASSATDYTDFTLTTPRAQGDPVQQPLTSGPATCIVPVDTDADVLNVINTLVFGSGRDAFDQMDFHMSQDNTEELLRIIRYKTAPLSGLISKGGICPIKNNTIYISREPALVGLSEADLESPDGKNAPISDPIKNDFDGYDFTGVHIKYWKRAIFIALPSEGLVLIYDFMRNLWHPPQTMPISRLGIVDDQLIGHSAVTNETYQLFVGTNDNGARINFTARFAYNNGGRRDRLKNQNECWTDGYISPNGLLNMTLGIGFEASIKKWTFPISGLDPTIVTGKTATPLGNAPFGSQPLGGANTSSPHGTGAGLYRFEQIDTVESDDYFEQYVQYDMNTLDGQFAIVAFGSDQYDAGTSPNSHKK